MMKKIKLLLAFMVLGVVLNAQTLFMPSQTVHLTTKVLMNPTVEITKFKKITGNTAELVFNQNAGTDVYYKIRTTADTNSVVSFYTQLALALPGMVSDTIIVSDTLKSYAKVYTFVDSLGTMPLDSTPFSLMVYDPIVTSYSITPIIGGYVRNVIVNPGNTRCVIKSWVGIYPDTNITMPYQYKNDTIFAVGLALTFTDSVKNLSSPQTPLQFCDSTFVTQLVPWAQTIGGKDCGTTLIAGAFPNANWLGQPVPTSSSVSFDVVTDGFGQAGTLVVVLSDASSIPLDSVTLTTTTTPGAQTNSSSFNALASAAQYKLSGHFTTSYGTVYLPIRTFSTLNAPTGLTNVITSASAFTHVEIDVNYTNVAGNTCNITVGYGMPGSGTLLQSQSFPNKANNGSFTCTLPLPTTTGIYLARVYAYDEQTFAFSVEDTMSFYVGSLTGLEEAYHLGDIVPLVKIYDILGKYISEKRNVVLGNNILEDMKAGVYILYLCNKSGIILQARKEVSNAN